jgi:hypothetical protein
MAMLAGVVALAMLVGGCGGSSEDESLTKAEFISQADAICTEANEEYKADYEAFLEEESIDKEQLPSEAQGLEFLEEAFASNAENRLNALRDLSPPAADEKEVEAFFDATEQGLEKVEKNVKTLYDDPTTFTKARELGSAYGFKVCGLS